MNDAELDRQLRAAQVPARSDDYWEKFPRRVAAARRAVPAESRPARAWWPRFAWAGALAAALVAGFILGRGHAPTPRADTYAWLRDENALREVFTLFPNRVRAIVQDERGVHLVLSEQADVPSSPPLWIEFDERGRRHAAVTFSGQELQIGGERVEVLANPQGQVTLVGDGVFWSSAEPASMHPTMQIQARALAMPL